MAISKERYENHERRNPANEIKSLMRKGQKTIYLLHSPYNSTRRSKPDPTTNTVLRPPKCNRGKFAEEKREHNCNKTRFKQ
jgi:hypothetical protein